MAAVPLYGGRRAGQRRRHSGSDITVEPPLRASTLLRPPVEPLPFPFGHEEACVVADARSAWLEALATLGLGAGDEVLLAPSADGALLSALGASGAQLRWYSAARASPPEAAGVDAMLSERTRAIVLSHPLGVAVDAQPWRDWCDHHRLILLEDAAHALYATTSSGPVGRHGHAAVFSLASVLGTPDGAVVITRPAGTTEVAHDLHRGHLAPLSGVQKWSARLLAVAPGFPCEVNGVNGGTFGTASPRTIALLPILADEANADRRRANFRALLALLGDRVPDGWSEVPPGSSPIVFPVESASPAGLLERLSAHRVTAWPLFAARPVHGGDPTLGLERSVGLPVHHDLGPPELDRIVGAVARERSVRRRPVRLEWADDLRALSDEWDELALRARNPFAGWLWASVWWGIYGRGKRPAVLVHRRANGSVMGIVPLYEARRGPMRVARFIGQGPADEQAPVCDPADRAELGWMLRRAMIERRLPWDILLAERMPVEEGWSSSVGGLLMRRESSPVIALAGMDWNGYRRTRSRNFRDQIGRRERRLQREHALHYRLSTDPDRLDADLGVLFDLHRARWGARSNAYEGTRERFHREWAAAAQRAGWLRLWLLELDGRPVAAWQGLRFAETEFYYQAGRDPAFEAKSVGSVLLAHTIRAAAEDGVREYRLLRGGEPYKARFASGDRPLETRAVPCSSAGAAAVLVAAAVAATPGRDVLKGVAPR